jgi:hypothetical protein
MVGPPPIAVIERRAITLLPQGPLGRPESIPRTQPALPETRFQPPALLHLFGIA